MAAFVAARGNKERIAAIALERNLLIIEADLEAWVEKFVETERVYHMLVEKGLHQVKVVGRLAVQEQPDKHVSARPGLDRPQVQSSQCLSQGLVS